MTLRVERPLYVLATIAFGGVMVITAAGLEFAFSAAFLAGGLATWVFLLDALGRAQLRHGGALTPATWVTIVRGLLVSLVAGFVLPRRPMGVALWAPGALYAVAALGDGVDGALARRTRRTTALGASLDVTTDVVGLVVAPLVAVRWGRLPPWYLALAAAYPVLRGALALRDAFGLPVFRERLQPDPRARRLAGVQMGVVAAALFPVLPRALTWTVATAAMLPTLALFVREWRLATRSLPDRDARAERLHA
jgi:CDP-diacylglycerol---glycerol-3-phosphate 3-phosphatidyltransferase